MGRRMAALLRGASRTMVLDPRGQQQITCPGFDPMRPIPRSWGCKSTLRDQHICAGHENSRPAYMHLCTCGRRWAE